MYRLLFTYCIYTFFNFFGVIFELISHDLGGNPIAFNYIYYYTNDKPYDFEFFV